MANLDPARIQEDYRASKDFQFLELIQNSEEGFNFGQFVEGCVFV